MALAQPRRAAPGPAPHCPSNQGPPPTLVDTRRFLKSLEQDDLNDMASRMNVFMTTMAMHDLVYLPPGYIYAEKATGAFTMGLKISLVPQTVATRIPAFGLADLAALTAGIYTKVTGPTKHVLDLMMTARDVFMGMPGAKDEFDASSGRAPFLGPEATKKTATGEGPTLEAQLEEMLDADAPANPNKDKPLEAEEEEEEKALVEGAAGLEAKSKTASETPVGTEAVAALAAVTSSVPQVPVEDKQTKATSSADLAASAAVAAPSVDSAGAAAEAAKEKAKASDSEKAKAADSPDPKAAESEKAKAADSEAVDSEKAKAADSKAADSKAKDAVDSEKSTEAPPEKKA